MDLFPLDPDKNNLSDDTIAPEVFAPADVFIDATGSLTELELEIATVSDNFEELVAIADNTGPYQSGETVITWSATDTAGNVGTATQSIFITPTVSIPPLGRVGENENITLPVILSGSAIDYPVMVNYDVIIDGVIVVSSNTDIIEGQIGAIVIESDVFAGNSAFTVDISSPVNAVITTGSSAVVSVIETPVEPKLNLQITQSDINGRFITNDDSSVIVTLTIDDPNGTHEIDWSSSDISITDVSEIDNNLLSFNPETLVPGDYLVVVTVVDSQLPDNTFTRQIELKVSSGAKIQDDDNDGIPNDADNSSSPSEIDLGTQAVGVAEQKTAVATSGVQLQLGNDAINSGYNGIVITEDDVAAADADNDYPLGVLDFEAVMNVPGENLTLILPLNAPIPENAIYRKLIGDEWQEFVIDENNSVFSAPLLANNLCPDETSTTYVQGLTTGHVCLYLSIADGGPNDTDGEVNGHIVDPSGIAVAVIPPVVVEPDTGPTTIVNIKQIKPFSGGSNSILWGLSILVVAIVRRSFIYKRRK